MAWKLKQIELENGLDKATGREPAPGDWWFAPWLADSPRLADEYLLYGASRAPIMVCVPAPGGKTVPWSPDLKQAGNLRGWQLSGPEGKWTAYPEIDFPGIYRGWLQKGELTDDITGRRL